MPYLTSLLCLLTLARMKATVTSKGQITIPARIREKFGLRAGTVL